MGASKNMISGECLDPVNNLCVVVSVSRKKVQEESAVPNNSLLVHEVLREVNSSIKHAETSIFYLYVYSTETR